MLPFHIYDVFTDTAFTGNPLAIVEQADGLSTPQMQTIAQQFGLSETIFIQTPDDPGHTAKVRIFTPSAEIPFAGHPTIGCATFLADQAKDGVVTLEEVAGLVPVTIQDGLAELTSPRTPAPIGTAPTPGTVAAALGLSADQIGAHTPCAFEAGPAFIFAQVTDLAALAQARVVEPGWTNLQTACSIDDTGRSAVGLYVYTDGATTDIQARMFSASDGIGEDPATGSATAILAGQLLANGALPEGQTVLTLAQGVEMGRPSQLRLTIAVADGALGQIRVAGRAVPVSHGQTRVPS